jgi:ParB family chromosome partitioning protein
MNQTTVTDQTLDLHRLELRYAELRVPDALAITRLARSIAVNGQLVPCIAVAGEESALILLDGYRRVAALRQLGKDTAEVALPFQQTCRSICVHLLNKST